MATKGGENGMDMYLVQKMEDFRVRREIKLMQEKQDLARRVENVKKALGDHYEGTPLFSAMREEMRGKTTLQSLLEQEVDIVT